MRHRKRLLTAFIACAGVCALLVGWARGPAARGADLREQFGTKSLEAANHLDSAIKLAQAKKPAEAEKEIDLAMKLDPDCTLAYLWKALIVGDMGDIDKSIEWFKKCIDLHPTGSDNIVIEAECNLGLTYGKLQQYRESAYWLSRVVVEDEDNRFRQQAKAYRNLAVTLHQQKDELSATLAALRAYQIDPALVGEKMVLELLRAAERQGQEVARVLTIEDAEPSGAPGLRGPADTQPTQADEPRAIKTELSAAAVGGDAIGEKVTRLLPDPRGRYVIAIAAGKERYYLLSPEKEAGGKGPAAGDAGSAGGGGGLVAKAVTAPGPVTAACLVAGRLFLTVGGPGAPAKLHEVEIATGKSLREFDTGAPVESLAVLPSRGSAFVSANNAILRVDLATGRVSNTNEPGQSLTADPAEQFLYTRMKDPPTAAVRRAVVNGRPVIIRERRVNWNQTVLMKYFVGLHKLIPSAMRVNAASNGFDVVTSPDGRYVSVPGGGGWRPQSAAPGGAVGYVIPVFRADDFNQIVGSFLIDAYPLGAAFNPVTNQFAGVRKDDVKVYDLGKPDGSAVTLSGAFGGASAWSGDGRYLLAANESSGVSAYANTLSAAETARAATWFTMLKPAPRYGRITTQPAVLVASAKAIEALAHYRLTSDAAVARKDLNDSMEHGSTDRALLWRQYGPYAKAESSKELQAIVTARREAGLRIYKIKKVLEKDPSSVPGRFFLALAMRESGQGELAREKFLEVVREDGGRTELSMVSLNELAGLSAAAGEDVAAADCLAWSLKIDRAHGRTLDLLAPVLEKLKWSAESQRLAALRAAASGGRPVASARLPALPPPPAGAKSLAADEIYKASAASVVLIRTGQGSGTGVCVGKPGIIVTSHHVIAGGPGGGGAANAITVYPFAVEDGNARRLERLTAHALVLDPDDDLAVLAVDDPPASLTPLPVAAVSPGAGKAVFAIGNPGLGPQTLDLSLSQGIVATASRIIDGHPYLQHTASVNPGNSGGPLLNDAGQVVGLVCLKAQLEGVSFATPVEKIRALFPKAGSGRGPGAATRP